MANIAFDDSKGFCYASSVNDILKQKNSATEITNGFDLLPWDKHILDTFESEDENTTETDELKLNSRKKLTKQEKREQRQQKKINASRNKRLKRQMELSATVTDAGQQAEESPFAIQQEIKRLHTKIIKGIGRAIKTDFKLFQYQSIALYKSDLDHILPEEWINDNNISLIYELIVQLFLSKTENKFSYQIQLLYPSLVQLFLHIPIGDDFENILPVKELEKLRFIFIPMNYIDGYQQVDLEQANNGDHWVLCLLNLINNKLYVYDSMNEVEDQDNELLKELTKRLKLCKSIIKSNTSIEIIQMKCDQQTNFNDCGVYLLMITCCLVSRLLYDKSINLSISNVKFNAIRGRLYMLELIYKLWKQLEPK